jgi:hypothetical protein
MRRVGEQYCRDLASPDTQIGQLTARHRPQLRLVQALGIAASQAYQVQQ